jgi:hypothetical protein
MIIIYTKGPGFVMPFGKYKGQSLDKISDTDPGYICWLHDHAVFAIEPGFLDSCRMDEQEDDEADQDIWFEQS